MKKLRKLLMPAIFLGLFALKYFFGHHPWVKGRVSFATLIPLFFIGGALAGEFRSASMGSFLKKNFVLVFSFLTLILKVAGVTHPLLGHIFEISIGLLVFNIVVTTFLVGSYEVAVQRCLPERISRIAVFETRLLKASIRFLRGSPTGVLVLPAPQVLRKLLGMLVGGFCLAGFWLSNHMSVEAWLWAFLGLLFVYALTWPLGLYQLTRESRVELLDGNLVFSGLADLRIHKDDVLGIEPLAGRRENRLKFFMFARPVACLALKKAHFTNYMGQTKEFTHVELNHNAEVEVRELLGLGKEDKPSLNS